eukprot:5493864-Amphidinium_carterae.1
MTAPRWKREPSAVIGTASCDRVGRLVPPCTPRWESYTPIETTSLAWTCSDVESGGRKSSETLLMTLLWACASLTLTGHSSVNMPPAPMDVGTKPARYSWRSRR